MFVMRVDGESAIWVKYMMPLQEGDFIARPFDALHCSVKDLSELHHKTPEDSKVLSTRFARTWREKYDSKGNPIWLRRSRFAREFAWLDSERESLFSPASGSTSQESFQPS
jgi:hypothetical protein